MPVDMGQEGAQPVSALATVRSANTPLDQQHLVQHRLTALRAMLVDMEQEAVGQASAPVTVRSASIPLGKPLLGPHRPTALRVRMGNTLARMAAVQLRIAQIVYLGLQISTTTLQRHVRHALPDGFLV
jgi:hypothetical protein